MPPECPKCRRHHLSREKCAEEMAPSEIEAAAELAIQSMEAEIERLKAENARKDEALLWAWEMFKARDEMNAKVHCAPVRYSPITERCRLALSHPTEAK